MAGGKVRQSNFELYRILCIVLIVFMHSCSGATQTFLGRSVLNVLGNIGVTGFVLLSGYFGIKLKISKLIKLDILMIFGSLFELLVNVLVMDYMPTQTALIKCFIPFISHRYWFLSAYFALCILSPFINEYLNHIDEKTHRKLIFCGGFLYLVMPTLFFFDQTGDGGKGIVNMILVYVIGYYIGKYQCEKTYSYGQMCGCFVGIVVLNVLLNYLLYKVAGVDGNYYARDNSVFIVVQAIIMLLIFMKQKPFSNGVVNKIASSVVAVYVLEDAMRILLMKLLPMNALGIELSELLYMCFIAFWVVVVGVCVELVRKIIFGNFEDFVIKRIGEWIKSWKR